MRLNIISALRYEQDYFFLPTCDHDKVPQEVGNGEMKVAGLFKLPALIFYCQRRRVLI